MDLDEFDRAILEIVQVDNQRSHANIGEKVNLSASSVRRRLAAMQSAKVITANVALTDPTAQGLTFIVHVWFEKEDPKTYDDFRLQMQKDSAVSQCYSVSGEFDFILIVHAKNPAAYEFWGEKSLMANTSIRRYSSSLVWSRTKFTTLINPTDFKEEE